MKAPNQITSPDAEKENKLSKTAKFGYSVGHVLNDLCASLWFTYGLIFYNKVAGMSPVSAGAALLIGQVADAIVTPIVGFTSDRQDCVRNRYGKRKTWHLVGTVMILLTQPFMYSPCIGCENSLEAIKMTYYCFFIICFQCAWAFVQISHLSLVPELSLDTNERTVLLSLRTTFAVLSNISVYVVALVVFAVGTSGNTRIGPADMISFQIIVYSICACGGVSSLIFHCLVREKLYVPNLLEHPELARKSYKSIFKRSAFYFVMILYLCARMFGNLAQSLIPLYMNDVLRLSNQYIAAVPLVMYVTSFLTSFTTGPLNKKFGRKITFSIGGILGTGATIGIALGSGYLYKNYIIFVVAIFLGCSQCIFLVTSLAIIADFIGNDTGNGAFVYGVMSFADKLGSGTVIMIVQSLSPTEGIPTLYYRWAATIVLGISIICGFIANWSVKMDNNTGDESSPGNTQH